ncbi:hypothetical protein WJX81_005556 [Elliptochloris bilobata]|uniref:Cytochrome c oxidase subunit n=1 Tax=Elliptochloris bilobata TaxID=381761 RepID=A0AAW1R290_9CHLO
MGVTTSHCEDKAEPVEEQEAPAEEPAAEDSADEEGTEGADGEEAEDEEPKMEVVVATAPHDPRFPSTNQARHCYTRYNEFYRCKAKKSEDTPECVFYKKAFRSLCPGDWVERWEEAREAGTWAGKY